MFVRKLLTHPIWFDKKIRFYHRNLNFSRADPEIQEIIDRFFFSIFKVDLFLNVHHIVAVNEEMRKFTFSKRPFWEKLHQKN